MLSYSEILKRPVTRAKPLPVELGSLICEIEGNWGDMADEPKKAAVTRSSVVAPKVVSQQTRSSQQPQPRPQPQQPQQPQSRISTPRQQTRSSQPQPQSQQQTRSSQPQPQSQQQTRSSQPQPQSQQPQPQQQSQQTRSSQPQPQSQQQTRSSQQQPQSQQTQQSQHPYQKENAIIDKVIARIQTLLPSFDRLTTDHIIHILQNYIEDIRMTNMSYIIHTISVYMYANNIMRVEDNNCSAATTTATTATTATTKNKAMSESEQRKHVRDRLASQTAHVPIKQLTYNQSLYKLFPSHIFAKWCEKDYAYNYASFCETVALGKDIGKWVVYENGNSIGGIHASCKDVQVFLDERKRCQSFPFPLWVFHLKNSIQKESLEEFVRNGGKDAFHVSMLTEKPIEPQMEPMEPTESSKSNKNLELSHVNETNEVANTKLEALLTKMDSMEQQLSECTQQPKSSPTLLTQFRDFFAWLCAERSKE